MCLIAGLEKLELGEELMATEGLLFVMERRKVSRGRLRVSGCWKMEGTEKGRRAVAEIGKDLELKMIYFLNWRGRKLGLSQSDQRWKPLMKGSRSPLLEAWRGQEVKVVQNLAGPRCYGLVEKLTVTERHFGLGQ